MATTSNQTTSTTLTVVQCGWIRKQEWTPSILYGSTSANRTTNDQPLILPIGPGRAKSHIRISLVRSVPTTYQLEKRMDRYYSTSGNIQCTQCSKGEIYTLLAKTSIPSGRTILHRTSNYRHTRRKPPIKNPTRISTTSQSIQRRTVTTTPSTLCLGSRDRIASRSSKFITRTTTPTESRRKGRNPQIRQRTFESRNDPHLKISVCCQLLLR